MVAILTVLAAGGGGVGANSNKNVKSVASFQYILILHPAPGNFVSRNFNKFFVDPNQERKKITNRIPPKIEQIRNTVEVIVC
jgi:hypothetical protein